MGSKNPDHIDFAGDYNLNGIIIQNHAGTGGNIAPDGGGVNIQSLVQELNIYEGINQNAVYGTLVVVDSIGLLANLPIQGTERLFFKLSTPGAHFTGAMVDASEETGHPFYVYKVSNKQQASQGTLVYTIHFASREFMRNVRTKLSKAYEGKLSDMVQEIIGDKDGLDSRKTLFFEETSNSDKIVMPNIQPFRGINMIAKKALPKYGKGAGYYFYETTAGFYFRSWENMLTAYGSIAKKPMQEFFYMPQNITDERLDEDKILHDLKSVESYKFINTFHDVAAAQALGTYGHRVITYNLFDKSHNTVDYNYHESFGDMVHADFTNKGDTDNAPAVFDNPVDFDNLGVSDYPESMVTYMATSQFLHNEETGSFGVDVLQDARLEGIRNAQKMQVEAGTAVRMTVKGQSYLKPGHVIDFNIRPVEPDGQTVDKKSYDPQYSGRYVICKIRHRVTKQDYKMVLECRKDSIRENYIGGTVSNFSGIASSENASYNELNNDNSPGHPSNRSY